MAEDKTVKLKYVGPDGMSNDAAGGQLVNGETYDVPEDVKDELLAHPEGWWESGSGKSTKE